MTLRFHKYFGLFVAASGLLSCNSGEGGAGGAGGGGGGPGGSDANAWVIGSWTGTFELKADDPETTTAVATFEATAEKAGNFTFDLPERENAKVEGTFQDFGGTSLMLKVVQSGNSSIGAPGSSSNLDYVLIGDALKLYNERTLVRLVRDKPSDNAGDDQDDPDNEPKNGLQGEWNCPDDNGNIWRFDFKSDAKVGIDIYDRAGTHAATWMDGTVEASDDDAYDAIITITNTDSHIDEYDGAQLGVKRFGASTMKIWLLDDSGRVMSCQSST